MPGATFSTLGWLISSLGFAYYVNNFNNYSSVYGGIGGVIVLMLWLYITSIIILLGGEINALLAFEREGKKKPQCKKY
jgi:membrane protein